MTSKLFNSPLVVAVIVLSLVSINASADCNAKLEDGKSLTQDTLLIYNQMINNTDNEELRKAYLNDKCTITKIGHGGGQRCNDTGVKNHITIKDNLNGTTCHLFPDLIKNNKYCTTC